MDTVHEIDVELRVDDARLRGTLALPPGPGPHPTVVALHGASDGVRDNPRHAHLRAWLPAHGFACLLYDRRGEGASTGDARTATFERKADDAAAWLDALRERPEVDRARVGVWGFSQAGWIGPLAAERRPGAVAFMALVSPSAVTAAEQMIYVAETQVLEAGYGAAAAERAGSVRRIVDEHFRGAVALEEARAARALVEHEPWFALALIPDPDAPGAWPAEMDLDIAPVIAGLDMPVHLFFGERDRWVPIDRSRAAWVAALPAGADLTVTVLDGAGHSPTLAEDPADHEERGPISPAYEQALLRWLARVTGAPATA